MTEKIDSNPFHFIYGLEYYLKWKYSADDYRVKTIEKHKKWFIHNNFFRLKDLLEIELDRGRIDKSTQFLKILLNQFIDYKVDTRKHLEYICHTIDDDLLKELSKFSLLHKDQNVNDFLSVGQIESKIWLIEVLQKIPSLHYNKIAIYGCWFGFLVPFLIEILGSSLIRGFDIDVNSYYRSDQYLYQYVTNNWQYKAVLQDVNEIYVNNYNELNYTTQNLDNLDIQEINKFDLIINTSSEHMSDKWIQNFKKDQIILIQTNNMNHLTEHVNCCESLDHAVGKYSKYGEIIWAGSKTMITDYERYMIILKKV
jgi:hypothetical protein